MRVLLTRTALAEGERPARGGGDPASVGAVGDRVDASRGRLQGQALGMAGPIDVVPLPAAALARAAVEQVLGPSRTSCAHSRCPVRRRCSSSSLSISLLSASRSDGLFSESRSLATTPKRLRPSRCHADSRVLPRVGGPVREKGSRCRISLERSGAKLP